MSGAVAAHAAYNGSGTQGLAVTNKIQDDEGDVMSVFWNKNDTTRQLLYGSAVVEIPSSGANTVNYGGSRLFTVNNDIDCLGDMYLEITATLQKYQADSSVTSAGLETVELSPAPFALQSLIERVEIQVGTQIWQTIENSDLRVVNSTELSPDAFTESSKLSTPTDTDYSGGTATTAYLVIPSLTKTLGPHFSHFTQQTEDGYPMAGAPHQAVKIKVVFVEAFPATLNFVEDQAKRTTLATELSTDNPITESDYYTATTTPFIILNDVADIRVGDTLTITPDTGTLEKVKVMQTFKNYYSPFNRYLTVERAYDSTTAVELASGFAVAYDAETSESSLTIKEKVPLRVKVTGHVTADGGLPSGTLATKDGSSSITSCRLFAKQQIMCNEEREQMKAMPAGLPKRLKMTQNAYTSDIGTAATKTIDLDHFSLYASHLIISGYAGRVIDSDKSSLGNIRLASAELKLNSSSFSGVLPGVLLDSSTAESLGIYANKYIYVPSGSNQIKVDDEGMGVYIFPLASSAYSGSCVPLNRFDSIRLTLKFSSTPQVGSSTFVNVTCVGETTALFKGGAASLAMY